MTELNKYNEFIYRIAVDITMACNNRCDYCYQLPILDNEKLFNRDVFEKIIAQLIKFREDNPEYKIHIYMRGGDPLLVIDRVAEFVHRVADDRTTISVFSNLNFKPDGSKMRKLRELALKSPINVICSVHDSSNIDWVKKNISYMRDAGLTEDRVDVYILARDSHIEHVKSFTQWMLDTYGPKSYSINEVLDEKLVSQVTIDKISEMYYKGFNEDDEIYVDDKLITGEDKENLDLDNVSRNFHLTCKLNSFLVMFDGTIRVSCTYPYRSHIDKGFEVVNLYCHNRRCLCETVAYKKLLRPKNAKV